MEISALDATRFIDSVKKNSEVSIWSTIVGIGMDLDRSTVEETSKTPGCNYATVTSSQNFKEMMDQEFDYTVVQFVCLMVVAWLPLCPVICPTPPTDSNRVQQ